jgi:murein DD-endopeptidase MepM/ murein hydrolase activator NlpD
MLTPVPAFLARHKRWLLALSVIPLFEVFTAFGVSPDTITEDIARESVVTEIALPAPIATDTGAFDFWREERVLSGESLNALLKRLGVAADEIPAILAASRNQSFDLNSGRTVIARVTSSGRLLLLRYMQDHTNLLTIERTGSGSYVARQEAVQPETRLVMRSGKIKHSLFGATDAADIPDSVASKLAEVFSSEIDFHRDLRAGDSFSVVYETDYHDARALRTGRLLAAEFVNKGKSYQAVHFVDPQGNEGYYTPEGKSMKRAFLKSPIPFSRVSSGFSMRFHPVLQTWRAHKGIDYAAPTGTPILAISDGVVASADHQRGYGNLVVLKHQGEYSSAYGHMSRFGEGIKKGVRVKQGQVIGYVGATGMATGPHLHYEFRVKNVQIDPLAADLPIAYPLEPRQLARFMAETAPLANRLQLLNGRNTAALE